MSPTDITDEKPRPIFEETGLKKSTVRNFENSKLAVNTAIDTLQYAAFLVKRWGQTPLPNGETLENMLAVDGVSLWDVTAPILAAFVLPKTLARKAPLSFFSRFIKPYLSWAKYYIKTFPRIIYNSNGPDHWPSTPVCLFLGFSGYMYRDVLDPIVNRIVEDYHMDYVVLHDDGLFQESVVKLQGDGIQSIWDHRNKEVADHESRLRNKLNTNLRFLKYDKTLPTLVGSDDIALWPKVDATFRWLSMAYIPSLVPYLALAWHILEGHRPVIIISPDVADPRTRIFCLVARSLGIPSLEIQFGMYEKESVEWRFLVADRVAVWGESSRQALLAHDVPAGRITLTGSPRFDKGMDVSGIEKSECRSRFEIPAGQIMVLFASMYSLDSYSEFSNFPQMLADVKRAIFRAANSIQELCLVVKPHPLENVEETKRLAAHCGNIIFAEPGEDIKELITACDIFITLASTATMHALIARKLVIQPAFSGFAWWGKDVYQKSEVTYVVRSEEELLSCMKAVVGGQGEQMLDSLEPARLRFLQEQIYQVDGRSASRIAALAVEMMKTSGCER
jgi:hypothetical protein